MKVSVLVEDTSESSRFEHEHGLSLFIEACGKRILFDAGQTDMFARNARRMGIDLSDADAAVISHGHYDHTGGIRRFLELNGHAPVYVQRNAFVRRKAADGREIGMDPALLSSRRVVLTGDEFVLGEHIRLCTCNAEQPVFPSHSDGLLMFRDGVFVQDDFCHEQYLCIDGNGKRVVFSGCSHKGALNILRWLQPDVFIGGFHFMSLDAAGSGKSVLDASAWEMSRTKTEFFTCHCTGCAQFECLKQALGGRMRYISAGMQIECLNA